MSSRAPTHRNFAVIAFAVALSACGGGGGGDGGTPPPSGGNVTVSGAITFDRVPFDAQIGNGLAPSNPVESPAPHVVVEAIDASSGAILASTTTDETGDYSLSVPSSRSIFVRAKAQMLKTGAAPTWNFRVLNNTNSDALYALDGDAFDSGTANSTRNLHAPSGWGTSSYTGTRAAAPFAILESVFHAKELILSAEPTAAFPALDLFWSSSNRPASPLCPDEGNIGTTFYQAPETPAPRDQCAPANDMPSGIYILGDFVSGDTDEFDQHVIAHEFGHYFEDRFSRSDSLGGDHFGAERLDMRVAFGEGWGNAYSGMALGDPEYRDSYEGVSTDFGFNVETDETVAEGWFSEASVGEILWDIYDGGSEPGDTVELGFTPIYEVMTGTLVETEALTSIFAFAEDIREAHPSAAAAIGILLSRENITPSANEFGDGETNDGGDDLILPIYRDVELNAGPVAVCTQATAGAVNNNKLGNRKFLRFLNDTSRLVTIQANGAADPNVFGSVAATDPDIFVFQQGEIVAFSIEAEPSEETIQQASLDAGLHIIEVYDFDLEDEPSTTRCMTVAVTGS